MSLIMPDSDYEGPRPQGRPPKFESSIRIVAAVPQEMSDAITRYCVENNVQKAEFFRRAAIAFLDSVRATSEPEEGSAF